MKKILFKKLSGAGNDFVLIDQRENENVSLSPEFIAEICDRRRGVGADGVLEIKDTEEYDFSLSYYNADGFPGSLCGNGSRCAIKYANDSGRIKGSKTKFLCDNKVYKGEVLNGRLIKFYLNPPENLRKNIDVKLQNSSFIGDFIDSGSPHFVTEIATDINEFEVDKIGKEIRLNEAFSPEGTNVNFVQITDNIVNLRTFERGVEAETFACGTGCVASAYILFLNNKVEPPVKLKVLSKETLIVDFIYKNKNFENVSLVGPADQIFAGEYYLK